MLRKDAIDVTRFVLVAADGEKTKKTRPTDAPQVPVLRGSHAECEANGPDGVPEGQIDEVFTVESLCTPCAVAKALSETTPAQKAHVHE